jgi:phage host-nuclease inhibitor protein Gam
LRKLFVSYARENKPDVDQLVEHLRTMGYDKLVRTAQRVDVGEGLAEVVG